ncbi:Sucrose operon repressor, LacI family [Lactococcus lactis]|nr:Sucrose operon repressor, LacI family [Lactococcus lactis]
MMNKKERDYLALLLSNQVDGIIYGSHNLKAHDYIAIEAPIVAFDRLLTPETTVVSSDNFEGGILATKALINSGSKKIAIFTGNDNTNSPTYLRRDGYLLELERNQLKPHIIKIPSQWTLLRKKVEIKKILENNDFDGVFCTDDLTAILVKDLASNLKKSLNVVGFDGTEFIENYYPNLTTIKQPINDLAELLVDLIIRKIDGDNIDITYQLPVQLHYGID